MIRIIKTTILMAALSSAIVLPSLAQDKEPVDMRKIMKTYFAPRVLSPEVHANQTVTFRYLAPNAQKVELNGQFLKKNLQMVKDENGIWTVTTGKLSRTFIHMNSSWMESVWPILTMWTFSRMKTLKAVCWM